VVSLIWFLNLDNNCIKINCRQTTLGHFNFNFPISVLMVQHFTGRMLDVNLFVGPLNHYFEPIYELSSDICFNVWYTNVWNSVCQNWSRKENLRFRVPVCYVQEENASRNRSPCVNQQQSRYRIHFLVKKAIIVHQYLNSRGGSRRSLFGHFR